MRTVREILRNKGSDVYAVPRSATVMDAVREMIRNRTGAVVVTERGRMIGVFTERDVLTRIVAEGRPADTTPVATVMSQALVTCGIDTPLDQAARMMRDHRIRRLPICDRQGDLVGLITIGDLNAYHLQEQEATITELHDFITAR